MEKLGLMDSEVDGEVRPSRGVPRKVFGAAAAVGLFCAGGWAGEHFSARAPVQTQGESFEQLEQIIARPKRDSCSKSTEDCYATGCCSVVGYNCFTTTPGKARCLKNCTPSARQSCTQPQSIMDPILQDAEYKASSLYCFALYTENTGSTKTSHELETLSAAIERDTHVFACDAWDVFSDVTVQVGQGAKSTTTIKVVDTEGDFHFAKRKVSGTWVNTGIFSQVWREIGKSGKVENVNWVAKVDADAIFIPNRLRQKLGAQMVPTRGIYLENCKFVDYGYFGNLEVYSTAAFKTLLENLDMCKATLNWKVGIKNGKYGPMGEDLFAQTCLDKVGTRRVEAFDITVDGACPADRPEAQKTNKKWKPDCQYASTPAMHPFKKLEEWVQCYDATVAAFGS